jgi:small conductance mechanosensitive channel
VIIISALSSLGIPTTSIIAVFSAAAVAIGLAMKDSLGNVAGGILLLFSKPFRTGDIVEVKGLMGTVTKVDIIYTTFNTFDNKQFIIPNGQLINEMIINYSREEKRRLDLVFPVSYAADISKAKEILAKVLEENEKTLKEPAPIIGINKYTDNAVNLAVYVWCRSSDHFDLMLALNEKVKAALEAEGIEIPTVNLRIKGQ